MPDIFANQGDFQGWFDFSGVGSGANEAADQNIVAAEQKNQVREATAGHGRSAAVLTAY
jgi:hypothetical protein